MFEWLKTLTGIKAAKPASGGGGGSTVLPPAPVPKVKNKQQSLPSYLKTATPNPGTALSRTDRGAANLDLTTYRSGSDTRTIIRDFAATNPDLAAAVFAYIRLAITGSFTAVAYNTDGTFNRDATSLLQQILVRFNRVQSYDQGFSGVNTMRSVSEMLAKELMYYGSCSLELVLDKTRLPSTLQPISVTQITFYPDKNGGLTPTQKLSGTEINLDIPSFFYTSLDQDLLEPYSISPLEPALQPVVFALEFMNDLRRIVKRVVHPRLGVTIDEEKFKKNIPSNIDTPEKVKEYMDSMISDLENRINGLKPEDALVYFDVIGVNLINNGNISLDAEYQVLTNIINGKLATGAKTLPSVLGHGSGSQNIASSETMLFMKAVQGAVQEKLNEIYSRALTLAIRLFGQDVYVDFKYEEIDLRPKGELEAFKVMRQSRILELLSYGFISDDEASLQLTGNLTPVGFAPLSGTRFVQSDAQSGITDNPYSGTSNGGAGGGALNQNQRSKQPKQAKGAPKQQPKSNVLNLVDLAGDE